MIINIDQTGDEEFDFTINSIATNDAQVMKDEVLWALKQATYIIKDNADNSPYHVNG